jgi:hypothetical protein
MPLRCSCSPTGVASGKRGWTARALCGFDKAIRAMQQRRASRRAARRRAVQSLRSNNSSSSSVPSCAGDPLCETGAGPTDPSCATTWESRVAQKHSRQQTILSRRPRRVVGRRAVIGENRVVMDCQGHRVAPTGRDCGWFEAVKAGSSYSGSRGSQAHVNTSRWADWDRRGRCLNRPLPTP